MGFDPTKHQAVQSEDGTFTAYSVEFDEHYHSTKDGALHESLIKHVHPALEHTRSYDEITILDICFGLGFNTLATLYALKGSDKKVRIYSPEFDEALIESLETFEYPAVFDEFKGIIQTLSREKEYHDKNIDIYLFIGDARIFVHDTTIKFDIVYQDAFSPQTNPLLWTNEYFQDISACLKEDGILTTYSTALSTRIALYENGLNVYLRRDDGARNSTLASKSKIDHYETVDVEHKMACNPDKFSLKDKDFKN